jgi:hypothetical protein
MSTYVFRLVLALVLLACATNVIAQITLFGYSDSGQLGDARFVPSVYYPQYVVGTDFNPNPNNFTKVYAGEQFSLFLTNDNRVFGYI